VKHVYTLPPKDRDGAIDALIPTLRLFAEGKPLNIKVAVAKPDRTPWQNRYLFGVAYKLLSVATGFEVEEVHEYLLGSHFGWREKRLPGNRTQQVPIRTTTTDENGEPDLLDGDAFWQFVEFVQRVGARQGVVIPDPDPNLATNPRRAAWKRRA
jgi:hypothetical protein